jgi:hypothetical protein
MYYHHITHISFRYLLINLQIVVFTTEKNFSNIWISKNKQINKNRYQYMQHSPFHESDSSSASQELPTFFIHHHIHNSLPLLVLSQTNPGLRCSLFPSPFLTKRLHALLLSPLCATCCSSLILLELITQHPTLKHLKPTFLPHHDTPSFTPTQNNNKTTIQYILVFMYKYGQAEKTWAESSYNKSIYT